MSRKQSAVEACLRAARKVHPDLYERTELVARVIDPAAFADDFIVEPESAKRLHESRQRLMRAIAMSKAQEVLKVLGVNTDTDWLEVLTEMASEDPQA